MRFMSLWLHSGVMSSLSKSKINPSTQLRAASSQQHQPEQLPLHSSPAPSPSIPTSPSIKIPATIIQQIQDLQDKNAELCHQLQEKCDMVDVLSSEITNFESDRMYCIIYELFQRTRKCLKKKNRSSNDDKKTRKKNQVLIDPLDKLETSVEMKALRMFRNTFCHEIKDSIKVLRKWRGKLMFDYRTNKDPKMKVSIEILSHVIEYVKNNPDPFKQHDKIEDSESKEKEKEAEKENIAVANRSTPIAKKNKRPVSIKKSRREKKRAKLAHKTKKKSKASEDEDEVKS